MNKHLSLVMSKKMDITHLSAGLSLDELSTEFFLLYCSSPPSWAPDPMLTLDACTLTVPNAEFNLDISRYLKVGEIMSFLDMLAKHGKESTKANAGGGFPLEVKVVGAVL
uniref:Uncharacterized protein MANES_03G154600 n=1 Tax=Rhizophora mucronata TaxID=61149 RepID=A0A2P2L9J5_RHIMU